MEIKQNIIQSARCISDHPYRSSGSRKTNALLKENVRTFQKTVNLLLMR